ncbi:MAG: penicillin-binding protein activator [Deltaproteobacteria bacterium]|nr:penicillin-binding protein activator [Deltaproteobacteria bacterium]
MSFKEADDLWDDIDGDQDSVFLQAPLAFKLAKIYYHTRDFDRSEKMLKAVSTRFAGTPYGEQARDLLRRLIEINTVEPNKIGVVLPLSGRYQQYGARALDALKLAFAGDSNLQLVVKDSAGDPPAASRAVEELVLFDHVIVVIGPLFSTEAWAAALKAEELSVPLVSLSHREGLPELGPWVFRSALTVKAQALALAAIAFEEMGMRRFALLYPRSQYGREFAEVFWDEVERRKGEIRGVESYDHDQTTFQEPVRKLVGRYYWMAREDYREAVRLLRTQKLPPHRFQMALEKIEKSLAPIIDFDAVVIPDSGRNLGLIAPALAVEDVVLTRDAKEIDKIKKATGRKEVHPVTLLGGSTWNTMQTVESCERYCENAVFVDGYYADSPDTRVRDFVTGFRDKTGAEPNLSEAQAFDAGGLVRRVLTQSRATDRKAFREALAALKGYEGVTGWIRFDTLGDTLKKLLVLTIQEGVIRLWQPDAVPARG